MREKFPLIPMHVHEAIFLPRYLSTKMEYALEVEELLHEEWQKQIELFPMPAIQKNPFPHHQISILSHVLKQILNVQDFHVLNQQNEQHQESFCHEMECEPFVHAEDSSLVE